MKSRVEGTGLLPLFYTFFDTLATQSMLDRRAANLFYFSSLIKTEFDVHNAGFYRSLATLYGTIVMAFIPLRGGETHRADRAWTATVVAPFIKEFVSY